MKKRVVVVDDDQQFTELITTYLNGRGYEASGYLCYADAERRITQSIDLVIIDIHLADGDGLVLLLELKARFPQQRHVILTGEDSLPIRLQSFAKGAADYMKKPIFPSELEARVRRLLCNDDHQDVYERNQMDWRYTKKEQRVVELLRQAKGQLVPIKVIEESLADSEAAVYTTISRLRKKIGREFQIKSSYGRGWYLTTHTKEKAFA